MNEVEVKAANRLYASSLSSSRLKPLESQKTTPLPFSKAPKYVRLFSWSVGYSVLGCWIFRSNPEIFRQPCALGRACYSSCDSSVLAGTDTGSLREKQSASTYLSSRTT